MNGLINLNKVRKARAKAEKRARGDENAARFGRTKAQKELERARAEKAKRNLDGKERE